MRYRLLETVRQYALDRLREAGEHDELRDRHLDVYLALAERIAPTAPRRRAGVVAGRSRPRSRELRARDRSCRRERRRARAAALSRADLLVEAPGQVRTRRHRLCARARRARVGATTDCEHACFGRAATCSSTGAATTRRSQARARRSSARTRSATSRRPPALSTCSAPFTCSPTQLARARVSNRPGNSRSRAATTGASSTPLRSSPARW